MSDMQGIDTIVAVATPPGVGALGVVRLSGPQAVEIAQRVFRPSGGTFPSRAESHRLVHGWMVDPATQEAVDEVMVAIMWAPRSYTREDVVEIDCHGGWAAQRAVVRILLSEGARAAEPGEFTRRAFINGRIDLAQAEAVLAVVRAKSAAGLRAAVKQLEGGLSGRIRRLRADLLGVLAQLEVQIDFADEDPGELDRQAASEVLSAVLRALEQLLATAFLGRVLDQGVRVAIVGGPNVGKSSLLNALVQRERAIVSEIPGTTRDTVEETLEIAGFAVSLVDTAGLRETGDVIEREGVERTRVALESADVVLGVIDLATGGPGDVQGPADSHGTMRLGDLGLDPARTILVGNKLDLVAHGDAAFIRRVWQKVLVREGLRDGGYAHRLVSAKAGVGIDELRDDIGRLIVGSTAFSWDEPLVATERQRALVQEAGRFVALAREGMVSSAPEEIVAEDVRAAAEALGRITGDELVGDLLDEVFSRFCIGK